MKKKILSAIFVIIIVAVAVWNVNKNNRKRAISDIALANIEAFSWEWRDAKEWRDSEVYECVERTCEVSWDFVVWKKKYTGTQYNCRKGSTVAHCWSCDASCN